MKTTLHYIATKKVAKHMSRNQALQLYSFLKDEGWTRDGSAMTKDHHSFVFTKIGQNKTSVSYRKLEVANA